MKTPTSLASVLTSSNASPLRKLRSKFKDPQLDVIVTGYDRNGNLIQFVDERAPDGKAIIARRIRDGVPVCGAKIVRENRLCGSHVTLGNGRCKYHGGMSVRGKDHHKFKVGKYARSGMPAQMMADYATFLNDPDMISTRHEIAILEARASQLMGNLDADAKFYERIHAVGEMMDEAVLKGDTDAYASHVERLLQIVKEAKNSGKGWEEVAKTFENRRKLVETQVKISTTRTQQISTAELMVLMTQIYTLINDTIETTMRNWELKNTTPSAAVLKRSIGEKIAKLIGGTSISEEEATQRVIARAKGAEESGTVVITPRGDVMPPEKRPKDTMGWMNRAMGKERTYVPEEQEPIDYGRLGTIE